MVRGRRVRADAGRAGVYSLRMVAWGSRRVKTVPTPGVDSTVNWPLWFWVTMKYDTDRPRPVPTPGGLVVKKGSKMPLALGLGRHARAVVLHLDHDHPGLGEGTQDDGGLDARLGLFGHGVGRVLAPG